MEQSVFVLVFYAVIALLALAFYLADRHRVTAIWAMYWPEFAKASEAEAKDHHLALIRGALLGTLIGATVATIYFMGSWG